MRKFIAGLVVGIVVASAAGVLAASPLIGKTVDATMPLIVNGNQASKDVLIIEDTSYLPVRDAATLLDFEVEYNSSERQVELTSADGTAVSNNVTTTVPTSLTPTHYPISTSIEGINPTYDDGADVIEIDGVIYMTATPYISYAKFEAPYLDITLPGKNQAKILLSSEYSAGVEGFIKDGYSFIDPSKLGITATIENGVLVLK